jgi:hypothetical protein
VLPRSLREPRGWRRVKWRRRRSPEQCNTGEGEGGDFGGDVPGDAAAPVVLVDDGRALWWKRSDKNEGTITNRRESKRGRTSPWRKKNGGDSFNPGGSGGRVWTIGQGGLGQGRARSLAREKRGAREKLNEGGHRWPVKAGWYWGEAMGGRGCHAAEVGEGSGGALGGGGGPEGAQGRQSGAGGSSGVPHGLMPICTGEGGADRWGPTTVRCGGVKRV